jgi:hypothetical protein
MKAAAPSPWPLLLSKLRQAARAVVTTEDLGAAGLDAETLLRAGVLERRRGSRWRPPGCNRHCVPNLDLDIRSEEGLVGVVNRAGFPGGRFV